MIIEIMFLLPFMVIPIVIFVSVLYFMAWLIKNKIPYFPSYPRYINPKDPTDI